MREKSMKVKFVVGALALTVAGGLTGCATPPYPSLHSATDCAYARPLPKHWTVSAGDVCQHFVPQLYHRHYHYRHWHHARALSR
jgi:hypothetical protein